MQTTAADNGRAGPTLRSNDHGGRPVGPHRTFAVGLVVTLLILMGIQVAVVVNLRAARAHQLAHAPTASRAYAFVLSGTGSVAPPAPAEPEVRLASLELPRPPLLVEPPAPPSKGALGSVLAPQAALDARPAPWLGPSADESIASELKPFPVPFDQRPGAWIPDAADMIIAAIGPLSRPGQLSAELHPPPLPPVEDVLAALAPMPSPFDRREPPFLARPVPYLEPHMESRENWRTRSLLHGHPGVHRVHFNPNVRSSCLPSQLLTVLYDMASRFGDVRVISGYRSPGHNRRVGGASRSMHLHCRAIDFYATGPGKGIISWLMARKDVGGYKRYPFGSFHIDNGPRRTW